MFVLQEGSLSPAAIGWAKILEILTPPIMSAVFALLNRGEGLIAGLSAPAKAVLFVIIGTASTYAIEFLASLTGSHSADWAGAGVIGLLSSIVMAIQARTVITTASVNARLNP